MLTVEALVTFSIATVFVTLVPGPDNLFVLSQSMFHGKKAGGVAVLGICTGLIFHTTAVALGLAVLFQSSQLAFTILKIFGAIYLVYLAWKSLTAKAFVDAIPLANRTCQLRKLYFQAVIINISNPKASMFFLAFLPQFVDVSAGTVEYQIMLLGGLAILASFVIYNMIVLLTSKLQNWIHRSPNMQIALNKILGVMFLSFAFKLATAHR